MISGILIHFSKLIHLLIFKKTILLKGKYFA